MEANRNSHVCLQPQSCKDQGLEVCWGFLAASLFPVPVRNRVSTGEIERENIPCLLLDSAYVDVHTFTHMYTTNMHALSLNIFVPESLSK